MKTKYDARLHYWRRKNVFYKEELSRGARGSFLWLRWYEKLWELKISFEWNNPNTWYGLLFHWTTPLFFIGLYA